MYAFAMIPSVASLNQSKVWMARPPAVRVVGQRVEMFQKGRWWVPLVQCGLTLAALWLVFDHYEFPQTFVELFTGLAGLFIIITLIIALWFRKEGPILIFDLEKACLSIPGHRLSIPASALEQFHIRDVRCPDGEGGTYTATALVLDSDASYAPFCVYVWSRAALEPVLLQFRTEVEKMMSEPFLPTRAGAVE